MAALDEVILYTSTYHIAFTTAYTTPIKRYSVCFLVVGSSTDRRWIFQNTLSAEFFDSVAKDMKRQEKVDNPGAAYEGSDAAQSLAEILFF